MGSAFTPDTHPVFESLEQRQLLSIMLDNGLPYGSSNYWAVYVDKGGSSVYSMMGAIGTNTIYKYDAFLDGGAGVVADFAVAGTDPVKTAPGTATSTLTWNVGGGKITVGITSIVPQGSQAFFNFYTFAAQGVDLKTVKFWQYMDSNFFAANSQCFRASGSIAAGNLVLEHVDVVTLTSQDQMSGLANGATLTGWAADKWTDLVDAMMAGGYDAAPTGTIDTTDLPLTNLPSPIGACYGKLTPGSYATSTLEYTFTDSASASITTILGRALVGGATITNQLQTIDPNYLAVTLDSGGAVTQTTFGSQSMTKDYLGYLQIGSTIYDLSSLATPPVLLGPDTAMSFAMLDLGGGSSLMLTISSSIAAGSSQLVTDYALQGNNLDLTTVKLLQYADPVKNSLASELFNYTGDAASNDLLLTTTDQTTYLTQSLSAGTMTNSAVTGFGADKFADILTPILAGTYSPSITGLVDTTDLPSGLFLGIGPANGPNDVTMAMVFAPTAADTATISVVLAFGRIQMNAPVLIVPDFLGSWPRSGSMTLEDFLTGGAPLPPNLGSERLLDQYQPLIDSLESMGYSQYRDLCFVGYDWRLPVAPTSGAPDGQIALSAVDYDDGTFEYGVEYLEYWIDNARQLWNAINPGRPFSVDLISHGMGGLIVRSLLQSDSPLVDDLGNIVCLGTPNEGEIQSLLWIANQDDLAGLLETHGTASDLALDSAATGILATLWSAAKSYGYNGTLEQWAPSIKDLLPTSSSYITSTAIGVPNIASYTNPLLDDLNEDLSAITTRTYKTMFGYGQDVPTITGLHYVVGSQREVQTTLQGDGAVTVQSALLPGLTTPSLYGAYPGVEHRELPSDPVVQRMILRVLGVNGGDLTNFTPATSSTIASAGNFIVGYVDPAQLLLTDAAGRRLGQSAAGTFSEMPGGKYIDDGDNVFFFTPVDAQTGIVDVTLTGEGAQAIGSLIYYASGDVRQMGLSATLAAGQTQQSTYYAPIEVAPVDNTLLSAADLQMVWGLSCDYEFNVTFTNSAGVDHAGIGTGDIVITDPDGHALTPQVITKSVSIDGKSVNVLLRLSAPTPYWQNGDEGTYTVNLLAGAVAGFGEEVMGDFEVSVADSKWYVGGGLAKQTIRIGGAVLTATWKGPGGGWIILNDAGVPGALDIELHDTSPISCLTLKGNVTIDSITVDGSMNMISAPGVMLAGDVIVSGGLKKLALGDVAGDRIGQHTISIGLPAVATNALTVTLGRVNDLTFTSAGVIASLTAIDWNDNADAVDALQAPAVGRLATVGRKGNARIGLSAVAGDFNADVRVTNGNLGQAQITGDIDGVLWDVSGGIGAMTVKGSVWDSTIRSAGSMGKIALGASFGNNFLAGVAGGIASHAAVAADFVNGATIGNFRITGLGPRGATAGRFFRDTNVSASSLGTINLLNGDFAGGQRGLYALSSAVPSPLKKVSHIDTVAGSKWSWPSDIYTGPDDFIHLL